MNLKIRKFGFTLAGLLFLFSADTAISELLSKNQLIQEMKKGGLILYIRHASTEKDYADQIKANVNDGSTQRVLSEKGWHEAVHIGKAFQFYNIPVGQVLTSQYFRAWQTAWLAFGKYKKSVKLNFLPFEDYSQTQVKLMQTSVNPILSEIPPAGTNTIIVAHDDPFEAVTGIYPEPMGVCFVIKPMGSGKFSILGKIGPQEWNLNS